eukprot:TRINITY_DN7100_c0_g2_i1.p2 TRINITY_DN7100_c0_g2~~TRINITY_DN7100_c0_g2_i1.p2  ORF type:complete len:285 (+),score=60.98 TRINITY_DN7100_c0_g2_i1:126-857(+)
MAITAGYLLLIWAGREIMKTREAFSLKPAIIAYNIFLVALNAWITYELVAGFILDNMNFFCNQVNTDPNNKPSMRIARACWWYYFSKIIEFMDTVFFVLKKNDRQLSFLHLFHHSTMANLWWIGVRWVPGGQSTISAIINAFVHIIMYSYYAMACIPTLKPYLWWKKYLTQLQLTQFMTIFVSTSLGLYGIRYQGCHFPEWMGWANLSYMIMMMSLFLHFYNRAYKQAAKDKAAKEKASKKQN